MNKDTMSETTLGLKADETFPSPLVNSAHPLGRNNSLCSIESDSGTEEDPDIIFNIDNKYKTYSSAKRFFNSYATKSRGKMKRTTAYDNASKEFFTLQFYNETDNKVDTEMVPVHKGKSLKESIETFLATRDLSFNTHSVFLESSKTPLPLAFDTFPLGGNTLHVKANQGMQIDERIITLMKGSSDEKLQGQRLKKNAFDATDSIHMNKSLSLPANGKISRKSGLFSSLKDMSRNISELLAQHTADECGVNGATSGEFDEAIPLEDSWTDVIDELCVPLSAQKIQQEAIWELLMTERNYLRKIGVITQVFQKYLLSLQEDGYLTEVDQHKLFLNIHEVYNANSKFWNDHLNHVVEEARATKQPIKPRNLLNAFNQFGCLFEPYIRYCLEESNSLKYLKRLKRTNELFEEYLVWCEENSLCMRLKLSDLLVKPMQRLTKYALLLKVVLKKTLDDEDRTAVERMISLVERFVRRVNATLRLRHEEQKMEAVLARFETYTPVEAVTDEVEKVISGYCNFDLRSRIPGLHIDEQRCILYEGAMKMVDKHARSDVYAFLFTDVFVIGKPKKGDKYRIFRQPFRLNKVVVHALKDLGSFLFVYLNEYGVLVTAFTLIVNPSEQNKWLQAINKAKIRYDKARRGNGSTLDFFDDDTSSCSFSPLPPRRVPSASLSDITSENHRGDDIRMHRRFKESRGFSMEDDISVKRSLSDPKPRAIQWAYDRAFGKTKQRPGSFVLGDQDTGSWTDLNHSNSVLSRRSSGIGDSFRSVSSDGGVSNNYATNYSHVPEVSNVMKLKAQFEKGFERSNSVRESHSLNNIVEADEEQKKYSLSKYSRSCDDIDETYLDSSIESSNTLINSDTLEKITSNESIGLDHREVLDITDGLIETFCVDASTQYENVSYTEASVQSECECSNVSTQCGDFIHLNSNGPSNNEGRATPLMDFLISQHHHSPQLHRAKNSTKSILKHAYSEANLRQAVDSNCGHIRSSSDEPRVNMRKNSTPSYGNGPGMRALMTLSESLESSLQQRSMSSQASLNSKEQEDIPNGNASPSLRKLAFQNSSPVAYRKFDEDECDTPPHASEVTLRENPSKQNSVAVRNTWHDFDSMAALESIEEVKYGKDRGLNKHLSLSQADMISSPSSKKMSFKKAFMKRFSADFDPFRKTTKEEKLRKREKKQDKKRRLNSFSITDISIHTDTL